MATTDHTVRCIDCGYLCIRAPWQGEWRAHQGYFEAERWHRENPRYRFPAFVPGDANAQTQGEFGCYRAAADLILEIAQTGGSQIDRDQAAEGVIARDRICAKWIKYEPGLAPAETLREDRIRTLEAERRDFENRLATFEGRFNTRLTLTAIAFAIVIGLVQLWVAGMSMVPESMGAWFGRWVVWITNAIAQWFHR
jgi:hypothetical protein